MLSFQASYAQTLKVMSFNIHHGTDANEKDNLAEMGAFIKSSGADIVGLQEVDSVCKRSGKVDQMKELALITGMHYAFIRHFAYDGGAYGVGILSKYPIEGVKDAKLSLLKTTETRKNLALLAADIQLPEGKLVTFATAHFTLDAETRLRQAKETIDFLKQSKYPSIFTGDLNAEPKTSEIVYLEGYFTDADTKNQFTFPIGKATKRIDYIYFQKEHLRSVKKVTVFNDNVLSDHLPLMAELELKRK